MFAGLRRLCLLGGKQSRARVPTLFASRTINEKCLEVRKEVVLYDLHRRIAAMLCKDRDRYYNELVEQQAAQALIDQKDLQLPALQWGFFGVKLPVPQEKPMTKLISSLNVPLNAAEMKLVNELFRREMQRLCEERDCFLKAEPTREFYNDQWEKLPSPRLLWGVYDVGNP